MRDEQIRKRCVLKKDLHCGIQVFFFEHCHTGDTEFDEDFIRVYDAMNSETPFVTLHKQNAIEISSDEPLIRKFGGEYPSDDWFIAHRKEWEVS